MSKLTYGEQLRHPLWQRKRLEVLEGAEWSCQCCLAKDQTLHVHHKRYVKGRMAWEYSAAELAALCETCHQEMHHADDIFRGVLAFAPVAGPFSIKEAMALVAGFVGIQDQTPIDLVDPFPSMPLECNIGYTARSMSCFMTIFDIATFAEALADPQFYREFSASLQAHRKRMEEEIAASLKEGA